MKHTKILTILLIILLGACTANNSPIKSPTQQPMPVNEGVVEKEVVKELPKATVKEFNIEAFQFSYNPSEIHVKHGDKVIITLSTRDVPHSLNIKDYEINIPAAPNNPGKKEFIANKVGTFEWNCRIPCGSGHQAMSGKLVVE